MERRGSSTGSAADAQECHGGVFCVPVGVTRRDTSGQRAVRSSLRRCGRLAFGAPCRPFGARRPDSGVSLAGPDRGNGGSSCSGAGQSGSRGRHSRDSFLSDGEKMRRASRRRRSATAGRSSFATVHAHLLHYSRRFALMQAATAARWSRGRLCRLLMFARAQRLSTMSRLQRGLSPLSGCFELPPTPSTSCPFMWLTFCEPAISNLDAFCVNSPFF